VWNGLPSDVASASSLSVFKNRLKTYFIHDRFCACAVQMLLKMAVNATVCSAFEVQYGKSTSSRTTAI